MGATCSLIREIPANAPAETSHVPPRTVLSDEFLTRRLSVLRVSSRVPPRVRVLTRSTPRLLVEGAEGVFARAAEVEGVDEVDTEVAAQVAAAPVVPVAATATATVAAVV